MSSRRRSVLAVGKRKTSKARVVISEGKGRVRINNTPIQLHEPWIAREKIMESLRLAGDYADKVDIKAKTQGGGVMSQAEAVRMGIAQGLVKYTRSKRLRSRYMEYDRTKFGGPGARRRKQKSYR